MLHSHLQLGLYITQCIILLICFLSELIVFIDLMYNWRYYIKCDMPFFGKLIIYFMLVISYNFVYVYD